MNDLVLIEANKIKKIEGNIEAAKYLSSQALLHPLYSDLFFKYYFKSIDLSKTMPDRYVEISSSLQSLVETLDFKRDYSNDYFKACDYLFDAYIRLKDYEKTMQTTGYIAKGLNPNSSDYLLKCIDMFRKIAIASRNRKTRYGDISYLHHHIVSRLLEISWQFYLDLFNNLELYDIHVRHPNINSNSSFKEFDVYNNIKESFEIDFDDDELTETEKLFYIFDEEDVDLLIELFPTDDYLNLSNTLNNLMFTEFPQRMGFKTEFLERGYNDLISFGEHFAKLQVNKEAFPSQSIGEANKIANEFMDYLMTTE